MVFESPTVLHSWTISHSLLQIEKGLLIVHLCPESGMKTIGSRLMVDFRHMATPVKSPGNVDVRHISGRFTEVIVCDNSHNAVVWYRDDDWEIVDAQQLLANKLDIPDGVAISQSGKRIAISNHETRGVLLPQHR